MRAPRSTGTCAKLSPVRRRGRLHAQELEAGKVSAPNKAGGAETVYIPVGRSVLVVVAPRGALGLIDRPRLDSEGYGGVRLAGSGQKGHRRRKRLTHAATYAYVSSCSCERMREPHQNILIVAIRLLDALLEGRHEAMHRADTLLEQRQMELEKEAKLCARREAWRC